MNKKSVDCSYLLKPRCEPGCPQTELDWRLLEAVRHQVKQFSTNQTDAPQTDNLGSETGTSKGDYTTVCMHDYGKKDKPLKEKQTKQTSFYK